MNIEKIIDEVDIVLKKNGLGIEKTTKKEDIKS